MAGNPLASLFVKLGLDPADFNKGIDAANSKAGSLGKAGIDSGKLFSAGMVTIGAGLGAITVAGAQAERAQGEFMAATGKSREEAKAFVSEMDGLAGSAGTVGKSFADIAATGTMVEQQFGTTGQATADLTATVLEFAKVSKQDATGAAAGLEDTLSAYGLSADQAAAFTDQLVASSQKYGTDVGPAQIDVLRKMAPALQAVGGNLDDGIGFLNLYEQAGGDAASATKGLTAAITKLPEGENLDQFVTRLSNLKEQGIDPTEEAIKVFGAKAGVGLAAAIKPGMTSMSDLAVSAEDAAGTVDTAADNMLTTSDRIKGIADKFLAGAREIGQKFGPLLTGAASAASLAAPLLKPFAAAAAPAAKAFAGAFKSKLGTLLSTGISFGSSFAKRLAAPFAAAIGGALGKLSSNAGIGTAMDKLGGFMGGRLGGGMATAFKAAGILALIAVAIDQWGKLQQQIDDNKKAVAGISSATGDYLAGMPSPADVQAKIDALKSVPAGLDGVKGALYNLGKLGEGNVIGSAFDALFGANPAQVADDKIAELQAYLDGQGTQSVAEGVDSVAGAIAPDGANKVADSFDQLVQSWEDGSKAVIDNGQQLAEYDPDLGQWLDGRDFLDAEPDVQANIEDWIATQNTAIDQGAKDSAAALEAMQQTISDKLSGIQDAFDLGIDTKKRKNISGVDRLKQMADDIEQITKRLHESIAANDPVNTAYWQQALGDAANKYDAAKQSISVDSQQIAADVQTATGSSIADLAHLGNKATDAAGTVNQAAQQVNFNPAANNVAAAADDMHDSFKQAGQSAGAVPAGVQDHIDDAAAAAQRLANAVSNPLSDLNGTSWGSHLATTFVAGMRIGNKTVSSAAAHWANLLDNKLGFSQPPPEGPLHNVPHWGPHMIEAWLQPMARHGRIRVSVVGTELARRFARLNDIEGPHPVNHDVAPLPWHHGRQHHGPGDSSPGADSSSSGDTYNITVRGNIYGQGGIKQLAADLDRYRRRSKRGGDRFVGAF